MQRGVVDHVHDLLLQADAFQFVSGDDGAEGGEETVTIKKSELEKIKSDRDNYREIGLDKKSKDRELKQKAKEGEEGEGAGSGSVDETKFAEIARKEVHSFAEQTRKSNQQRASKVFLSRHKEYVDDALWNDMMSDFRSSDRDVTVEDFADRLEETVLLHKRRTGKLEEYLNSERERGRREGRTEAELGVGHQAGGVGERNEGRPAGGLSEKGKEISRGVNLDPEKVAKVDPSKDNVIQV